MLLRRLYRRTVPARHRTKLRRIAAELPQRISDLVPDVTGRVADGLPVPPASLRARVGQSSSRDDFLRVGHELADSIVRHLGDAGVEPEPFWRWLDFGCGCGRVARSLLARFGVDDLVGVDTDEALVGWCRRHLAGRYLTIAKSPPTGIEASSVDVAVAVSVFTHLDEGPQLAWLAELGALLRPGGVLVASTHSPELTFMRPDLSEAQHRELQEKGFLFAPGFGPFNDDGAFHSEAYLSSVWGRPFERLLYRHHGLGGFQDVSIWRKS